MKVYPLKQKPVYFRLGLLCKSDLKLIQFVLKSTNIDNLDCGGYYNRDTTCNAKYFTHAEEVEVSVFLKNSFVVEGTTTKIGSQSLYANSHKNSLYFLCIVLVMNWSFQRVT